jgi:predicted transcriptional regulator
MAFCIIRDAGLISLLQFWGSVKVGIISRQDYIKRTLAIAKGEYKPRKDEPKIWFESIQSLAQVLSTENQKLLRTIIQHEPRSIAHLESLSHRNKSNLSRTLSSRGQACVIVVIGG